MRTFYGLSDQRIVIVGGAFGTTVRSLSLRSLPEVTLAERADGSGTIQFGQGAHWGASSWFAGTAWPGVHQAPAFDLIDGAKHVFDQIRQAQQRAV